MHFFIHETKFFFVNSLNQHILNSYLSLKLVKMSQIFSRIHALLRLGSLSFMAAPRRSVLLLLRRL